MARLNLFLFGGFRATIGARSVVLPLKKAQALLAFLALSPAQRQTRERLAALFWGETPEEQARNSLRQTLFTIRGALGRVAPRVLGGDPGAVWLETGAVDAGALASDRVAAQDTDDGLVRAVTLYQGDLLDGVELEVSFAEGLAPTRERLRRIATSAMVKLLARQSEAGAIEAAIATATKLLGVEPTHAVAHQALIRLYAGTGRRAEAIRQYQSCVDLLRSELQSEPEPATVEAYRQALGAGEERATPKAEGAATPADGTPFVGRERELATLADHLRSAAERRGRVVAIVGGAGG